MNPKGKKLISLFLVFSLVMLSVNLYAKEKRGAHLIVTKKDGQLIEGELITVKKDSLLLFTGVDVSVDINDVRIIRIIKKPKVLKGLGLGLLIGGGAGALLGSSGGGHSDQLFDPGSSGWALYGGIFFGAIGLLIGGTVGFASGIDKTIQIEGKADSEIQKSLEKLREKARIRD